MGWPQDGVAASFLVCFFIGLLYTVASFFLGLGHDSGGAGVDHGGLHLDDLHLGGGPAVEVGHGGGHGAADAQHAGAGDATPKAAGRSGLGGLLPFLNMSTLMAFLTWFGGAGYILHTGSGLWLLLTLPLAAAAGLAGAALVFIFLNRVLYASQRVLDPRDYRLPGTLARVTSPIRAGGVGEIVYTKGDTRQVAGARSVDGAAIARGDEVVIMRYERGLAFVQRWEELLQEEERTAGPATPPAP